MHLWKKIEDASPKYFNAKLEFCASEDISLKSRDILIFLRGVLVIYKMH